MNQNNENSPKERATDFANWLEALLRANEAENPSGQFTGVNTRGVLAALRSGLSGEKERLWPYIANFLTEHPQGGEDWFFDVGALAGWHPKARFQGAKGESLGQTARALKENSASVNAHFAALLACHERDLRAHLRRIVGLLRAGDVAVDYRRLLHDLVVVGWNHPERLLQQSWARDFYRAPRDNAPAQALPTSELSSD